MKRNDLSQRRKHIAGLVRQRGRCERVAMGHAPMVAASFLIRHLPPTGRVAYYLSASLEGISRHRYVPKGQAAYWRKRAEEWRRFGQAMAQWVKLNREIEAALRALGEARCEPLPGGRGKCRERRRKDKSTRR